MGEGGHEGGRAGPVCVCGIKIRMVQGSVSDRVFLAADLSSSPSLCCNRCAYITMMWGLMSLDVGPTY